MMKSNYWSCSKIADLLRGTTKPTCGTTDEWNTWEKLAASKKIRYWLAEEGLDYLQNFIYWPINSIKSLRSYIHNRWITKSHALTSNLKRGEWHELDTRLLHAIFDELVNFVEIDQAWMQVVFSDDDRKKYKTPWYRTYMRLGVWRCAEAGIAHLDWAAQLTYDEDWLDKSSPEYGQPTPQALAAQEILALYKWWKEERPKRPEPMVASGWSDYCDVSPEHDNNNLTEEDIKRPFDILNLCDKMEKEQDEEDTAMLIRLVKIRRSLWT